ncbi:hypothetical protein GCM10023172_28010 [Hymenobacter ginsengisoli]|uniref:ATP synthase protein I n=1 Tax=Hymenobacter ginsengisoli TaxID=1051626 RepID=A0ABP8QM59_9BACT|nr:MULTISPECIES: hypothetical protein [unclassified Hymenobacter]MBO2029944.1 hypothetical protein [Hymenobacter sp. BT559]
MNARFLTQFAAFALSSLAVLFGLRAAFGPAVVHPLAPLVLGVLLALTLLAYWLTASVVRNSPNNFLVAYFSGVGVRLVLGIGIILVYFFRSNLHDNHSLLTFLGAFFIGYFLCAGFEIWAIFSNLRPFSAKQVPKA